MEIVKQFGIDWYLLAAQIVNFLILFFLLKKFAYKPIFKMLEDRKKTIAEGIKNAEESKLTLDKTLEEEKKILKKAQDTAQEILNDAKTQADTLSQETQEQTRMQVEKMIADAKVQIDENAKNMEKELALSTATLAVDMLKDALGDMFTKKEQEEVVKKMTKKFKVK